jgi:hypothetical protein
MGKHNEIAVTIHRSAPRRTRLAGKPLGGETMRRFLEGFALGIVIGAVLAWLYERYYLWSEPETVPTRPAPVKVLLDTVKPDMAKPDDFAILRGVGAAFAERLHQAGIHTFASLAGLTPEEVAERCEVPVWRIRRDDWIGQAAGKA